MERNNIHKTIHQLFGGDYDYIVPLYQRNFAWGESEIEQLLQDLYENYLECRKGKSIPYFVGSLIYIKRKEDSKEKLEVIDGQQRLTVLTLLLNILGKENLPDLYSPRLEYDSRKEVSDYIQMLYVEDKNVHATSSSDVIDTFNTAYETILNCELIPERNDLTISNLKNHNPEEFKRFSDYISSQIYFVLAEMPQDTDVATYFEIMNNTGDQLKKHEVVKSLLLASAQNRLSIQEMESLATIWDGCSQMDMRIQKAFTTKESILLFGEDFTSFHPENIMRVKSESSEQGEENSRTIVGIIHDDSYDNPTTEQETSDDNTENTGNSIMDFPNFLMHILRICYNDTYKGQNGGNDIPLNDNDLLQVFDTVKDSVVAEDFICKLLYYRIMFDRYLVRNEGGEDGKWTLEYLKRFQKGSVAPVNTIGESSEDRSRSGQEKAVMALSMLQVSYPQRKYKRYLNEILSWFDYGTVVYDSNWFMPKLQAMIARYMDSLEADKGDKLLQSGTGTPRFLLNLIDYLYYLDGKGGSFDFKYYNSVEHHLPKDREKYSKIDAGVLDSIGNLFLLSRRANSSLNDRDPLTKVDKAGNLSYLPPNRRMIYQKTKTEKGWTVVHIKEHTEDIIKLLGRRKELLRILELEENNLLYRACLCVNDYCLFDGYSCGGERYNFANLSNKVGKEAKAIVIKWLNDHPEFGLSDFINDQVVNNADLRKDSWRWSFAKYPSITEYCNTGKFAWVNEGKRIILLLTDRKTNQAHELHEHLLHEVTNKNALEVYIDQSGLWLPLNGSDFRTRFESADISLHIWVSENAEQWCYELYSSRSSNASENRALVQNGWIKNDDGHYFIEGRVNLCDCPNDYEESVMCAFKALKEIISQLDRVI